LAGFVGSVVVVVGIIMYRFVSGIHRLFTIGITVRISGSIIPHNLGPITILFLFHHHRIRIIPLTKLLTPTSRGTHTRPFLHRAITPTPCQNPPRFQPGTGKRIGVMHAFEKLIDCFPASPSRSCCCLIIGGVSILLLLLL